MLTSSLSFNKTLRTFPRPLQFSFLVLAFILIGLATIGCSKSEPSSPLLGTWKTIPEKSSLAAKEIRIEKEGIFYFDQVKGKWTTQENKFTIEFPGVFPNTYTYSFSEGNLVLTDQAGIAGVFQKAN